MKKITATILSVLMSFSLFACSKDAGTDNKDSDNEMAWTVKTITHTDYDGETKTLYTGEFKDNSFSMNYLTQIEPGQINRESMVYVFESDILTKYRTESQQSNQNIVVGKEYEITYDENASRLTRLTKREGVDHLKEIYEISWDEKDRIAEYRLTLKYLNSDEEYKHIYDYSYGEDSYTITCDEPRTETVDGEDMDVIERTITTIPYDEKADITTVISYYKTDGTTPVQTDYNETKFVEEKIISNSWGYETSHTLHFADGSVESDSRREYTFDNEGKISTAFRETNDGDKEKITFSYDANGNLNTMTYDYNGRISTLTFEYMEIPAHIDRQIAMLWGCPQWSAAEYIDNYAEFSSEGDLTARIYTKEAFLSYIQ